MEKKESLELLQKELTLTAGQSKQLTNNSECVWTSDEPLIVTVDKYGFVTAKRVGKILIHAEVVNFYKSTLYSYNIFR